MIIKFGNFFTRSKPSENFLSITYSAYAPSITTIIFLGISFKAFTNSFLKIIDPVGLFGLAKKMIFVFLLIRSLIFFMLIEKFSVSAYIGFAPEE